MLPTSETIRFSEAMLSRIIIEKAIEKLNKLVDVDVVVVGSGLSGLTSAWFLALNNLNVVVVDTELGFNRGIGYNNTVLPVALIEEGEALEIAKSAGIRTYIGSNGIYVIDPLETYFRIALKALESGAYIWLGVEVTDIITRGRSDELRVHGVMVNQLKQLSGEPLYIYSKAVVDATEYNARIVKLLVERHPELKLNIPGMSSCNIVVGDREIIEKTGMVVPGLYVVGGSAATLYNINRTGALISNLLISGRKVALQIAEDLGRERTG